MSSKSTTPVSSPTRTTLALIPYLNCEPFYNGLAGLGYGIVHEPPRTLGRLAESGESACGPMAVADWFRLRDRFDALENFGIACDGAVSSVLVFSKRPLADLSECKIGLTTESSTSVRLLRALVEQRFGCFGVQWHRGESDEDEARLLIGDAALVAARQGLPGFPLVADLGAEWQAWSGLPFVYARWVVAKDVPEDDRDRIADAIDHSLEHWEDRVAEIERRRGKALGMNEAEIASYLGAFKYRLGSREEAAERRFEELVRNIPSVEE